jgi:antibiotic biosynthesis monooxygenase (ABM) superfamily enzyme
VLHEPGSPYYHVVYKFTDRDRFRAWIESDERNRWLAEVERLTEDDPDLQQTTGLETWFDLPGPNGARQPPPPRWKMWLVSLLAVYPLVLLTLMTYVVMPVVTWLLRRVLRRSPEAW